MVIRNMFYSQRVNQYLPAVHYKIIVKNEKIENDSFDPKGEQYEYEKKGRYFKCGEWSRSMVRGGLEFTREQLTENLNVTNSGVVLYSDDHRILDREISRGDKIEYDDEVYTVFDFRKMRNPSRSPYQRKASNKILVLSLT